jgi:ABC-type branched-subunit amino acid transport system ATPase component
MFPVTHFGRLVIVLACFWGMITVSQFVYTMQVTSELSHSQFKAFRLLQRIDQKKTLKDQAASLIINWWRSLKVNRNLMLTSGVELDYLLKS